MNGIPVSECLKLVESVKTTPEKGETKWKSSTTWKGGLTCESKIRDHTVIMDEPKSLGGSNSAPNMVEVVLAAYGSCLTVGYTLNASIRGIKINELKVEVEGDLDLAGFFGLDDEVKPGFSKVIAKVHLTADAPEEELQKLHQHVLKTSPVGSILTTALPVETNFIVGNSQQ